MRWSILETLMHKELLRHLANRGTLLLVAVLVSAALVLALTRRDTPASGGISFGIDYCYVDYWDNGPLIDHLKTHVPPELAARIRFRPVEAVPASPTGILIYSRNTGAIQVRALGGAGGAGLHVECWYPGADAGELAPFEAWFWKECLAFFQPQTAAPAASRDGEGLTVDRKPMTGGMTTRSGLAIALVLFALFFVSVYLMPSVTCEERERGLLLAQALSPALPREIVAAKLLFYAAVAIVLATVLAATHRPLALLSLFFWLALLVATAGYLGIGLTIASLARTQRAASMGAMSYMLVVALVLVACQQTGITALSYLAFEFHAPQMLHAALTDSVTLSHWLNLSAATALAACWIALAGTLFRRRGWQ